MSEQPLVCCVMLTRDRPEMAKRAVECFRRQTYENKRLLIVNSGPCPLVEESDQIWEPCFIGADALTIGALRNLGNDYVSHHYLQAWTQTEIFVHWDDDDVSHSSRLTEQVTLLQASGADCVGYSDMLFWRDAMTAAIQGARAHERLGMDVCGNPTLFPTREPYSIQYAENHTDIGRPFFGEAWLYLGPQKALGTSLAYWRRTWERKPFPDQPRPGHANGEDTDWIKGLEMRAVPSTGSLESLYVHFVEVPNIDGVRQYEPGKMTVSGDPRMIASIHGANTSGSYKLIADSTSWRRVPEWDEYCRERMAL